MRKHEIVVNGIYKAKVSGVMELVRVEQLLTKGGYGCRVIRTGNLVNFRSAGSFREDANGIAIPNAPFEKPKLKLNITGTQQPKPVEPNPNLGLMTKIKPEVVDTAPHLIIEARAGTGKTTTLIEGLKRIKDIHSDLTPSPQQAEVWRYMEMSKGVAQSILFVAFNKSIATELQNRVPPGCMASTMHSMGNAAVRAAIPNTKVNQYRVDDIISRITGIDSRQLRKDSLVLMNATKRIVSLCKMNLIDPNDRSSLQEMVDHYDIDMDKFTNKVMELVPKVWEACKDVDRDRCIDFDDMVWLPVILDLPVTKYDLLLVDEAQDLNRCQQELAKRAGKRLILCGDPKQAIYGFAGADSNSMSNMARELGRWNRLVDDPDSTICPICKQPVCVHEDTEEIFHHDGAKCPGGGLRQCVTLPLTVTRRCGKAIVKEANKIVPDFQAFDTNPEGVVEQSKIKPESENLPDTSYHSLVRDGDMVVCRVNAPLVKECFKFLKMGRKANIQGRDIGQGLITTINKMKADNIPDLISKLADWLNKETEKELNKKNPSETRIDSLQDKYDCLIWFCEDMDTVDQVVFRIGNIFTDDKVSVGVKLSSIHKAKGLESHSVFFLKPQSGAFRRDKMKGWELQQESNLEYVAITRAIHKLVYVS